MSDEESVRMQHTSIDHLAGGTANSTSIVGDSLLRADWPAPPAQRLSGQRRYDPRVLYRLAIIQFARQLGFTLAEIRCLFFGFRDVTRASERWRTLSQRKLAELEHLMNGIKTVRGLLKKLMTKCRRHLGSMWQGHISEHA